MRTAAFQSRFMLAALDCGEPSRVARALATEASQLVSFGGEKRNVESTSLMRRAQRIAQETHDSSTIAFVKLMAGTIAFYQGYWREARVHCEDAERILRHECKGAAWEKTTSHLLRLGWLAW